MTAQPDNAALIARLITESDVLTDSIPGRRVKAVLADAAAALAAAEEERDAALRGGLAAVPNEQGWPGREERYWQRRKMDAAIRHLRDVEDFYRLRGGLPEGPNMRRADRARQLHEAITADYLNGKINEPTIRERADAAAAQVRELREALERLPVFIETCRDLGRGALKNAEVSEASLDTFDGQLDNILGFVAATLGITAARSAGRDSE